MAGGLNNTASSTYSTVGGGRDNTASGLYAVVPGGRDNTAGGDYSFAGGLGAHANHDGSFLWADSTDLFDLFSNAKDQCWVRASGGVQFHTNSSLTTGVRLTAGSGSWSMVSDREAKENFVPVDRRLVLEQLSHIPITTWNYKAQRDEIRHIGPVAQDFSAAFEVGEDERYISTVDVDGVALAAIQGLYELLQEKQAQIAQLTDRLAALEKQVGR